jgi:hypothetical protein
MLFLFVLQPVSNLKKLRELVKPNIAEKKHTERNTRMIFPSIK